MIESDCSLHVATCSRLGHLRADAAKASPLGRRDRRITDLSLQDGPRVQRRSRLGLFPGAAFAEHVRARRSMSRQARRRTAVPPACIRAGYRPALDRDRRCSSRRSAARADAGWYLAIRCSSPGSASVCSSPELNNYTLAPIEEERVSEAAGVNSAAGSFGLSFGLAFAGAIDAGDARVQLHQPRRRSSTVLTPEEQVLVADAPRARRRGHDEYGARRPARQPAARRAGRDRSGSTPRLDRSRLQVALLIPIFASLLGFVVSLRMARQPDPVSASVEGLVLA